MFDISCSSNYPSKIYQKWDSLIYLARVITRARYIENGFGWYIENGFGWYIVTAVENVEKLAGENAQITMTKMHTFW